jgi:hypothetical protein
MLRPIRPPQFSFEQRRGTLERQTTIQGQDFTVSYALPVAGAGEALVDINFPVWFSQEPTVSQGGVLRPNTVLVQGNYPEFSIWVFRWKTRERNSHVYYEGATLACVVKGDPDQRTTLHFLAQGPALQNPV